MDEIHIRQQCSPRDAGRYLRLPLEVPADVDRLDLSYSYPRTAMKPNVLDIGLLDADGRVRGWSGSERREVMVSSSQSTPGYRAGAVGRGRWTMVLGLYRILEDLEVRIAVRFRPKSGVLLAGDLHVHTLHSDGAFPTEEVIRASREAGLDFIALTDHNNTEQNLDGARGADPVVISGMEYTNYRGHANFLFPGERERFDEDPFSESEEAMREVFLKARARGALIVINHPACPLCPWTFGLDGTPFDMLEVWNGSMKPSETKAAALWHGFLARGLRIPAVGGSDMHRKEPLRAYGSPTTFVWAASRAREDILGALRAGRSFLSCAPDGPRPDLRLGETGLGGTAPHREVEGEVSVAHARAGDLVRVLDRTGCMEWRVPPDPQAQGRFCARFPARADAGFYRVEVLRGDGPSPLCALTNPIFIE